MNESLLLIRGFSTEEGAGISSRGSCGCRYLGRGSGYGPLGGLLDILQGTGRCPQQRVFVQTSTARSPVLRGVFLKLLFMALYACK